MSDGRAKFAPGRPEDGWAALAVKAIADALVVVDPNGVVVHRNPAAERALGDASMTEAGHFFLPDETTLCAEADLPLARALAHREAVDDVALFFKNDASATQGAHVLVSAAPLLGEDGSFVGAACVVRDLSQLHGRGLDGHVQKERLALLGQLAGGVAHQIRNPLAAIMNATYVLKRHLPPNQHPNIEDATRIIHDEVRHANDIITGLLDYARVRTPDRHPTCIVSLVGRVATAEWMPDNVRVRRIGVVEGEVLRDVDADQIQRSITNLVRNSLEAMPNGGELTLGLRLEGEAVVITVRDSGPGISPHVRPHLFEPLRSSKPMGIGLGLVVARRFVEAHGGQITNVDVDVEKGSAFEIRLP